MIQEVTTKVAKDAKRESGLLFREESYRIIGACFEVYSERFVHQKISRPSRIP